MARKSLIQREKKRQRLEQKYRLIRRSIKKELKKERFQLIPANLDKTGRKSGLFDKEIMKQMMQPKPFQKKMATLPRDSSPTRLHRRCFLTGRPRANYRDFGLSGQILREMVHACLLPGATRSSW
uniref:ribosomal protein S14 n=1 Tax=Myosurus apetalus TaxID=2071495 RepID=UPI0030E0995C